LLRCSYRPTQKERRFGTGRSNISEKRDLRRNAFCRDYRQTDADKCGGPETEKKQRPGGV